MMAKQESKKQREPENLHERYGKIGISAVVAALTYQGDAKNPAYAPVTPRDDQWYEEAA
jgi:hypothetical protein